MRVRLHEKHSDKRLQDIYAAPHQHGKWFDHRVRVQTTIALAQTIDCKKSAADLSAGDATIIKSLDVYDRYIGDFAPGYEFAGAIEETIHQIPNVELFICSETLEHLDDPDSVLKEIRKKADWIVVSTPLGETGHKNLEHYWGWDAEGVESMLVSAGWKPFIYNEINFKDKGRFMYDYQIWLCQ